MLRGRLAFRSLRATAEKRAIACAFRGVEPEYSGAAQARLCARRPRIGSGGSWSSRVARRTSAVSLSINGGLPLGGMLKPDKRTGPLYWVLYCP